MKMPQSPSRNYLLVRLAKPMTPLECETIETYHHFKVLKKSQAKKLIIFDALSDIDKSVKQQEGDGASTNYNAPEWRRSKKGLGYR